MEALTFTGAITLQQVDEAFFTPFFKEECFFIL
jgi:hypothetical protein